MWVRGLTKEVSFHVNSLLRFRAGRKRNELRVNCVASIDPFAVRLDRETASQNSESARFMRGICLLCFFSQWLLSLLQHEQLAWYPESVWLAKLGSKMPYTIEGNLSWINVDHLVRLLDSQHALASLGENAIGTFLETQENITYFQGTWRAWTNIRSRASQYDLRGKDAIRK